MPVKASSGHWEITNWVLSFASSRSIATNSIGIEVPPLDDEGLVVLGAGHYEAGCQWCHGSPDERRPKVPLAMTPHPPYLPDSLGRWEDAELFYIVKHGIKFTGMPGWPSKVRADDAWPVVAFLRVMPEINADEYRRMVGRGTEGDAELEASVGVDANRGVDASRGVDTRLLKRCVTCHGVDGNKQLGGAVPLLSGQSEAYLHESLDTYASGARHSGIMETVSARLLESEREAIAKHYAAQKRIVAAEGSTLDAELVERGHELATKGVTGRNKGAPSCVHCHEAGADERYPRLAGQPASYLRNQLKLFKERKRGGGTRHHLMHPVVDVLTDDDMEAVAAYFASEPLE
jgi:cytochrome c553